MNETITPVLLGADLNCYNIARAFHEQYGVKSYAFGRYAVSATKYSKIINFTAVPDVDNENVMLDTLHRFEEGHKGEKLILFGCTDDYAMMISRCRDRLKNFVIPYPDDSLQPIMACKAEFYELCDKYGIPYPATFIVNSKIDAAELDASKLGFGYPVIVKPSSSIEYWKHPFDSMKKVYMAESPEKAKEIIDRIYDSGYDNKIIIQEYIEGGDSQMRVLTVFSDRSGKVRAMCLGHTMLEEHTPKGLGNHAAIVTEPVSEFPLADKIKNLLEDLSYTGYSNFDIKLCGDKDKKDFKVFEINLRQGRSNYYVSAAGYNIARLAAEVFDDGQDTLELCDNKVFWHHVPRSVAYKYTEDKELVAEAKKLDSEGREKSSLWYPPDLRFNPLRFLCVAEQLRRQKKKYKIYYPLNERR